MAYDYFTDNMNNSLISQSERLMRNYRGAYNTIKTVGVICLILSILLILASIMIGQPKEKAEGKKKLEGTLIAGIFLFCAAGLCQIILTLGFNMSF